MSDSTLNNIAALAAPLNGAAPCGENLEYDPQFLALEDAARGKPEVQYGSTITPATPPDWAAVRAQALPLMERSRDLRLAMLLTQALLGLDGLPGLAAGLSLLVALLEQQWEQVHPQLDPDDGNDPMLRVNVLSTLCQNDALLRHLRETPLAQVRALGSVSLRDLDQASSDSEAQDGGPKVSMLVLDAVFAAAGQQQLAQNADALQLALASAQAIERELTARVGVGSALDLAPLSSLLRRALDVLQPHLQQTPLAVLEPGDVIDAAAAAAAAPAQAPRPDQISSRADVTRALDKLCAYYTEHEPSSPVPLLLRRAAKLVDMSFTELLQELAPDGLNQLSRVSGVGNEQ